MATMTITVPDITLVSDDRHNERLEIFADKDMIEFRAGIDGAGQSWKIKKVALKKILE